MRVLGVVMSPRVFKRMRKSDFGWFTRHCSLMLEKAVEQENPVSVVKVLAMLVPV